MAKEIERKYEIIDRSFVNSAVSAVRIRQAYLSRRPESTVRVRIKGDRAYITVKGITCGCSRDEWEYEIPVSDAEEMISRCAEGIVIDKTRYIVNHAGHCWEIDEFHGCHEGLVIGEVELSNENESFELPSFVGRDLTGDPRYYNSNLASSVL